MNPPIGGQSTLSGVVDDLIVQCGNAGPIDLRNSASHHLVLWRIHSGRFIFLKNALYEGRRGDCRAAPRFSRCKERRFLFIRALRPFERLFWESSVIRAM
jgi:hypothetical protein